MKPIEKLSAAQVKRLLTQRAEKELVVNDGLGLYLQVAKGEGARSWVFKYTLNGRQREYGLGSAWVYSLQEARERARAARQAIDAGRDLVAERQREKALRRVPAKSLPIKEVVAQYVEAQRKRQAWSANYEAQWRRGIEIYAYPELDDGNALADAIDTEAVLRILQPIWKGSSNSMGARVQKALAAVLDFATAATLRSGENPARWKGHLEHLLGKLSGETKHHGSMPYQQIPDLMKRLRGLDHVCSLALQFLVLTGSRASEVLGVQLPEIDFEQRLWKVEMARFKSRRHQDQRIVPLSSRAVEILIALAAKKTGPFIFPSPWAIDHRRLPSDAFNRYLANDLGIAEYVPHGFRSSLRTWASEESDFPTEIAEAAIGHKVGDQLIRTYHRGTFLAKRRLLAQAWDNYCSGTETDNVTLLRSA